MSEKADLEGLYAATAEAAGLLGIACSREKMSPVLTAFQDLITDPVVFNIVTSKGRVGDLSFDFMTPPGAGDPRARALAHGLVDETDHPIRSLFTEIQERFPLQSFGVDYGVTRGFNKAYAFFPLGELQSLADLAAVPSMPRALSDQMGAFADHGLGDKVSAVAVDYARRSWNVYFNGLSPQHVGPAAVTSMLREFGLPEPSEQFLEFAGTSAALYPTFGWDSSKVERLCFSTRTTDPAALPARIEPKLGMFAAHAPYAYDGDRVLVYAGAVSPAEEYYKLASYHRMAAVTHDRVRTAA
ncbi:aromatic prenyltransferase [Streptomyces kunmingensis]|uniref:Aromatic prenyltransferase n=1 Tax=Streptomyces kunmingensis TaxID=68225 RepID=A0ABU6CQR5_9ACTN|nr:aromatic prenyltransferase [Streptomyces kunmingensis]MEB3967078.1 aromatic prenyltransferase [Streptomyces kunmingensis]